MNFGELIMPLISLVAGIISVYIDPQDAKKRWLLIVSLVGTAVITILLNLSVSKANADQQEWSNSMLDNLSKSVASLSERSEAQYTDLTSLLKGFGNTQTNVSQQNIERSIQANNVRERLLASKRLSMARGYVPQQITVRYFPKDVDEKIVSDALHQAGFRYEISNPVNNLPTNAIWVGNAVSVEDAKLVALTLIRAGAEIKTIRRFADGSGPKAYLIQVGADPANINLSTLTVDQINSMTDIERARDLHMGMAN